jgi:hypothetical protein
LELKNDEINFVPLSDRAAKGSWRKSGDRPVGVDWNERVINIHQGGWNYVANSVGIAPGIMKFLFNDESYDLLFIEI